LPQAVCVDVLQYVLINNAINSKIHVESIKKNNTSFLNSLRFKVSSISPSLSKMKLFLIIPLSIKKLVLIWNLSKIFFTTQLEAEELINWNIQSSHWLLIIVWWKIFFVKKSFFKKRSRFHKRKKNVMYLNFSD